MRKVLHNVLILSFLSFFLLPTRSSAQKSLKTARLSRHAFSAFITSIPKNHLKKKRTHQTTLEEIKELKIEKEKLSERLEQLSSSRTRSRISRKIWKLHIQIQKLKAKRIQGKNEEDMEQMFLNISRNAKRKINKKYLRIQLIKVNIIKKVIIQLTIKTQVSRNKLRLKSLYIALYKKAQQISTEIKRKKVLVLQLRRLKIRKRTLKRLLSKLQGQKQHQRIQKHIVANYQEIKRLQKKIKPYRK